MPTQPAKGARGLKASANTENGNDGRKKRPIEAGRARRSRKEVFQPHLPVRLPCYDFTPLTLHTFGASLTRLGRRLRVQTTRVV